MANLKTTKSISTKKVLIWSGVFLTVGVTGYLVYRGYQYFQKKIDELKAKQDEANNETPTPTSGGASGGATSLSIPPELNTTDKIKAFQDWCDANNFLLIPSSASNPKWSKLNKGAGYGTFGKNTRDAWNVHKNEYLASLNSGSGTTTSTPSDEKKENLVVIKKFTGASDTLMKSYATYSDGFLEDWADAIINNPTRNAFIHANKVYTLKNPKELTAKNPLGKDAMTKVKSATFPNNYVNLRNEPNLTSYTIAVMGGKSLGKVKQFKYNTTDKNLYLYVPDYGASQRWVREDAVTY